MEEALRQPVRLGRSMEEEGPGPAPLGENTAGQEHSRFSAPWAPVLGRPWLRGRFQRLSEPMGNILPFHCQCEPHLWLQDLPPTAGALSDPSERPLWTEEQKTEGKTQFSQEDGGGEAGIRPFACLETQVPGRELHVAYGHALGSVPFHRPLTSLRGP